MLGHKLFERASNRYETWVTVRRGLDADRFEGRAVFGVDAEDFDSVVRAVSIARPTVVINCVGIVKQAAAAKLAIPSLKVNALFPHQLAQLCQAGGSRLIHVSTDCVFSGSGGRYLEESVPDAQDLYGRTKLLGEVVDGSAITVRTSIIGRELSSSSHGLVEWFLKQDRRAVSAFTNAVFSGFTTTVAADLLLTIAERSELPGGLYHAASEPITKFRLLQLLRDAFGLEVAMTPVDEPRIDRSLDGTRLNALLGMVPPTWPKMVAALAAEQGYVDWRRHDSV